ncbi:hypothetical protein AMECASPLE_039176 [Ameca splendens]|uniref:Uncharacterized protein n=1 Tax=Ameca splendens TaxID=208324 RepID=A0ABV0ZTA7_9TELE
MFKKKKISFSSTSTVNMIKICVLGRGAGGVGVKVRDHEQRPRSESWTQQKIKASSAIKKIKIYVLTSAELSCTMSHRSNRTRTVLQQEQRKSSKHDLNVSELLQKVFPMLTKGDAGEEETLSLLSLYFTVRKKEIKNI